MELEAISIEIDEKKEKYKIKAVGNASLMNFTHEQQGSGDGEYHTFTLSTDNNNMPETKFTIRGNWEFNEFLSFIDLIKKYYKP